MRKPSSSTVAGVVVGLILIAATVVVAGCQQQPRNGSFGCSWMTTEPNTPPTPQQPAIR